MVYTPALSARWGLFYAYPSTARQEDLFGRVERQAQLDRVCDQLKTRFGEMAVFRAASLTGAGVLFARG
ncbi:hypothetical protein [Neomoorella thermoacetica]|uniref:hypothetical protein n=1 Tax=Neomoorella thermoacetica TaxID=1525 RepID=UPI0030CC616C